MCLSKYNFAYSNLNCALKAFPAKALVNKTVITHFFLQTMAKRVLSKQRMLFVKLQQKKVYDVGTSSSIVFQ